MYKLDITKIRGKKDTIKHRVKSYDQSQRFLIVIMELNINNNINIILKQV